MEKINLKHMFAFTLAEVLITLGIIGVIASLTIPVIINKYQKQVTVVKLKKVYSIFSQAGQRSFGENYWDNLSAPTSIEEREQVLQDYVLKYLKVQKYCGNTFPNDCVAPEPKMLNGSPATSLKTDNGSTFYFTLIDGTSVTCWEGNSGNYILFYFDINGGKEPNTYGKDVFSLVMSSNNFIAKQGVVMTGSYDSDSDSSQVDRTYIKDDTSDGCNKAASGAFCGALIQIDGWEIADDYPW